jgi:o-succinylbenzoate---CoA ligase
MKKSFSFAELFSSLPGESIFLYTAEKSYSYDETLANIEAYKIYLAGKDFTYAALRSDNNADMVFVLMALWSLKIIPLLLNTRLTPPEIEDILNITGCNHLLSDKNFTFINTPEVIRLPISREAAAVYSDTEIDLDETAVIIFTSGTTGKPKGVELTFRKLRDAAYLQNEFLRQSKGEKWMGSLPFFHIGGLSIITRALFNKSSVVIPSSLKYESLKESINRFYPEYFSLVGTQLKYFLDEGYPLPGNIKKILLGGGFTDEKLIKKALRRDWRISGVYGSTETAAFIAAADVDDLRKYPSTAGKELVKGSIYILDNNYIPMPVGSQGEVALKNIPLMKGYLNDEKGTNFKYANGYFLTGDIGYINEEGYLFILMRREDLIVSGGENINPFEVETAIKGIKGIIDAVVFAVSDEEWGQVSAAAISSSIKYKPEEIKEELSLKLAGYKIPKRFIFLDQIPLNDLGKRDLKKLTALIDTC